jgi:hypothetical protein
LVEDPAYTYGRLAFLVRGIPLGTFSQAFVRIADRSLVHDFTRGFPAEAGIPPAPEPRRLPGLLRLLAGRRRPPA